MAPTKLTFGSYAQFASATVRKSTGASQGSFLALGLVGEIGSLLSEVKKKQRDALNFSNYETSVLEEFGDCIWYINAICTVYGFDFSQVAQAREEDFAALQPQHTLSFSEPSTLFENTLLSLSTHAGNLTTAVLKEDRSLLEKYLKDVFSSLLAAASEASVQLEDAAKRNLQKIQDRWPTVRIFDETFDESYPPYERLPECLTVNVYERTVRDKVYVVQETGGVFIGDRITDNITKDDDYRFHDVFHYSYAAVLGWSPVTRALLKRKRKSETKVDEGQDSARAVIIEEGIATFIFGQAKKYGFFKNESRGEMSFTLLKQVRQFIEGFEAERCPLWLWEEAILQGCEAFTFLRERRRGRLTISRSNRLLSIEEMKDDPDKFFG